MLRFRRQVMMRIGWSTRYHGLTSHMWRMPRWGPQRPRARNWVELGGTIFLPIDVLYLFGVSGSLKSAEGDCFGYIGISTDFNGWRLDQCCLQILALDSHIISTNGLETAPKKLIFYPILCGILKSQDLKPLQWRWCSSTGGSLISPSIRCRNGQVGEWYGGWKLAKIESDWRCM